MPAVSLESHQTPDTSDSPLSCIEVGMRIADVRQQLFLYAKKLCNGNKSMADDLVQEASLSALKAHERFDGGNMLPWLYKILRRQHIDNYHKRKLEADKSYEVTLAMGDAAYQAISPNSGDIDLADENMLRDYARLLSLIEPHLSTPVAKAIQAVKPEFAHTLILVDVLDYSYAEAAEILNIKLGTVLSRISRIRNQLREPLKEHAQELYDLKTDLKSKRGEKRRHILSDVQSEAA